MASALANACSRSAAGASSRSRRSSSAVRSGARVGPTSCLRTVSGRVALLLFVRGGRLLTDGGDTRISPVRVVRAVARLAVMNADALSTTPAAQAALETLRSAAGADSRMERHCLRQFA